MKKPTFIRSAPGRGVLGQMFTLFSVLGVQLLQVPAYLHVLSADEYGSYLALIAIPSALTLADFGLLSALSTRLTTLVARGKVSEAQLLFRMGLFLVWLITIAVVGAVVLVLWVTNPELAPYDSSDTRAIVIQFTMYSLLFIASASLESAMRAAGAYADAWIRLACLRIADFACGVFLLYVTGSVVYAVTGMLASRIIGLALLWRTTRARVTWISFIPLRPTSSGMAGMLRPTIGSAALPMGNAALNQGVILAVHAALGAHAVAVYSTTRTLANVVRQLANVVSNGILPNVTELYATGRSCQAVRFQQRILLITMSVLAVCAVALVLAGPWVVNLWTLGRLESSYALLGMITAQVLIESAWVLVSVRLLARNIHFGYAAFYAMLSFATVGILFITLPQHLEIVPMVTGIQSLLMLSFVIYQCRKAAPHDLSIQSVQA